MLFSQLLVKLKHLKPVMTSHPGLAVGEYLIGYKGFYLSIYPAVWLW